MLISNMAQIKMQSFGHERESPAKKIHRNDTRLCLFHFSVVNSKFKNLLETDLIASDVAGDNRILIMKIKARHSAKRKAIKIKDLSRKSLISEVSS